MLTIARPHRPDLLRPVAGQLAELAPAEILEQPELRLVHVAAAVPPPLSRGAAVADEGERLAVRRRRGVVLVDHALVGDHHWRAAGGGDAVDVVGGVAGAAVRGEVDPLAVARPGVELIARVVAGQPPRLAAG